MTIRPRIGVMLTGAVLLATAGCGTADSGSAPSTAGDKPTVITSFYPLEFAVQRIGGADLQVTNLTKLGADAHDLELTPRDVATLSEARLVVYSKGFQPALDEAVANLDGGHVLDVSGPAQLIAAAPRPAIGGQQTGDHDHDGHDHDHDKHDHDKQGQDKQGDAHDHDHGASGDGKDPHFWLDPQRFRTVVGEIATRLGDLQPDRKEEFQRNATALDQELAALDGEYRAGLATCRSKDLVTGHAAFGYLAQRYGLNQVSIAGLTPEAEPDPATLAAVADYAKKHKVATVYAETLASPAVAQTVARETGATLATLDPLEGLTANAGDANYLSIMRTNLATLRKGQGCS